MTNVVFGGQGSGGEPGPRQPEGEPGQSPEVNQTVHSLHTEEATVNAGGGAGSRSSVHCFDWKHQGLLGNICTAAGGRGGRGDVPGTRPWFPLLLMLFLFHLTVAPPSSRHCPVLFIQVSGLYLLFVRCSGEVFSEGGHAPSPSEKLNFLSSCGNLLFAILADAADGNQTFLRLVCDAVCGRGLISAHHRGRTRGAQAGDSQSPPAALQVLAPHQPGPVHPSFL